LKLVREYINEAKIGDILKPMPREEIIDSIAHMSKEEKREKILSATDSNNVSLLELLLKSDNKLHSDYWYFPLKTSIFRASIGGYKDIVELLLKYGVDVNARSITDSTPLIFASKHNHKDIVKLLLKAGAEVNAKDNDGWTALKWASHNGHRDVVKLLKQYGAKK